MAGGKTKWPVIAGFAFIVVFVAAMAYSTLGNAQNRCEVCVTYGNQTLCRGGAATSKEEAERIAVASACTDLGHGMTEFMQCQTNAPRKVTWKP